MSEFYVRWPQSGGSGGGGVTTLNGESGAVVLVPGTGISITPAGQNITISNTESAFTPGNLTDAGTDGITITGGTNAVNGAGTSIAQHVADSTHNGYLSSTDWSTFNAKQPAGSYALTDLSNLVSTSVNANIVPGSDSARDFGTSLLRWDNLYVRNISAGASSLSLTGSAITMNGLLVHNVADPTSAQDAATKNYVDTHSSSGTVTSVSVVSANGLAGTVATPTTTPAITLSTTVTGILQGNGTSISAATTTGTGSVVLAASPTLVTPALGTPSALVGTNITGTASGLTAGTVTTNANLTGDVTSVGNATSLVATTNSTITTLSALSLPGSQVTGDISGNAANVTGTITETHGGTNQTTYTTGDILYASAANTLSKLPVGANGDYITVTAGVPAYTSVAPGSFLIATIKDVKPAGTNGGTFTAGAWQTRDLNTLDDPFGFVTSVSSNQFTLPAGTYYIDAAAPAADVAQNQARLFDITNTAVVILGSNAYCAQIGGNTASYSNINGVFVVSAPTVFEIQHQCVTTFATAGFGIDVGSIWSPTNDNIYTQVVLTKIA